MTVTAIIVSDDVLDICDDESVYPIANVDDWLSKHEAEISEAMEYAGKEAVKRLLGVATA